MFYVFENGRVIADASYLRPNDKGKYLQVETIPEVPLIEGKSGYVVANLKENKLDFVYVDIPTKLEPITPEPPSEPEPYIPTTAEINEAILDIKSMQAKQMASSLGIDVIFTPEETQKIAEDAGIPPIPDGIEWRPGLHLVDGTIVTYKGKSYIVIDGKSHISQAGWDPITLLGNLFEEIKEDYAEWVQPYAHNPYMKGDKVSYQGEKYISEIDINVHAPGIVPGAWTKIT